MNERSNCLTSSFAVASEDSTEATEAAEERSRGQISTVNTGDCEQCRTDRKSGAHVFNEFRSEERSGG